MYFIFPLLVLSHFPPSYTDSPGSVEHLCETLSSWYTDDSIYQQHVRRQVGSSRREIITTCLHPWVYPGCDTGRVSSGADETSQVSWCTRSWVVHCGRQMWYSCHLWWLAIILCHSKPLVLVRLWFVGCSAPPPGWLALWETVFVLLLIFSRVLWWTPF